MTPDALSKAFDHQAVACRDLGSPFMGQLMSLCATRDWPAGPVRDRLFGWTGDLGPGAQSVPLRFAGALHALHLQGDPTLNRVYPPQTASDDALWSAVSAVVVGQADAICTWLDSAPQTNEVRRASVLVAVAHWLTDRFGLPIRTSELGASGGLNLRWDRYALRAGDQQLGPKDAALTLAPEWRGHDVPAAAPTLQSCAGVDLNPLNPSDASDALRLQAYLWPDQPERMTLTRAAIAAADTPVDIGDAIDWLTPRLAHQPGTLHLIYSTVAWQYFPTNRQQTGERLIALAGQGATDNQPLAWFGMENDGIGPGAALTLRLWPGDTGRAISMGRADFHGRWVDWRPPADAL